MKVLGSVPIIQKTNSEKQHRLFAVVVVVFKCTIKIQYVESAGHRITFIVGHWFMYTVHLCSFYQV